MISYITVLNSFKKLHLIMNIIYKKEDIIQYGNINSN